MVGSASDFSVAAVEHSFVGTFATTVAFLFARTWKELRLVVVVVVVVVVEEKVDWN